MIAGIPSLYFGGTACKGNPATGHTQDADLVSAVERFNLDVRDVAERSAG